MDLRSSSGPLPDRQLPWQRTRVAEQRLPFHARSVGPRGMHHLNAVATGMGTRAELCSSSYYCI